MQATKVERGPVRRRRILLLGTAVAALLLIALVVVLVQSRDDTEATAQAPAAAEAAENVMSSEEVATRFLEAYGAFDVERVLTYLAPGATIASLGGQDDPRLLLPFLEAQGYIQFLGSCQEVGSGTATVRCPFDFHAIRSNEIGRGPFSGSYFELIVRDGKILHLTQNWGIEQFGPQMWEPFARWISKTHPKDVAVMYSDEGQTNVALTEESRRLWNVRTREYVKGPG